MKNIVLAKAKVTSIDTGAEIAIELRLSEDGRYRWFETETGADTEVSGRTINDATEQAELAWDENLEMVS